MATQSFRGAGGAGVVALPYRPGDAAGEYEVTAVSQPVLADGRARLEGALTMIAAGALVVVGMFVAGWALAG